MDKDTIFPALSSDERIIGKYQNAAGLEEEKTIAIITNFRLLIRRKQTICCGYGNSHYSSIVLDSIDRIDETNPNRNLHIFCFIMGLLLGLIVTIIGFVDEIVWLKALGIIVIIGTVVPFVVLFFWSKKKFITLTGSFGSETIGFKKAIARQLEGQLSEMIHRRRIQPYFQQDSSHESLLPMAGMDIVETEKKKMKAAKIYVYEPLTNHP